MVIWLRLIIMLLSLSCIQSKTRLISAFRASSRIVASEHADSTEV